MTASVTASAVLLLIFKASLLLALALFGAFALKRASAARRHRLWTATFAALVALPLLAFVLPSIAVPVPALPTPGRVAAQATVTGSPIAATGGAPGAVQSDNSSPTASVGRARVVDLPSPTTIALAFWIAGALAALTGVLKSIVAARRLAAASTSLRDSAWQDACERTALRLGVTHRVRVLASSAVATPMAGGVVRPTVFVPAHATQWTDEQRDIVLTHELAHLAHRDPLRHLVARVAFALYWFHPFVWLASRRATSACEQACDDAVLALGVLPSTYARVLLGFASSAPHTAAALPIARRSSLETRLVSILNPTTRASAPRVTLPSVIVAVAAIFSLAAARPMPSVPAKAEPLPITEQQAADCSWERDSRSFTGSTSTSRDGVRQRIGRRGNDRIIQNTIGELRVCAVAVDVDDQSGRGKPSQWSSIASRVVLETQEAGEVRRMTIVRGDLTYTINDRSASVDGAALAWRDALLDVLDLTWDAAQLRGEVASKRGEIASIHGQRASLQGQIASIHGQAASMRGSIQSVRGEEASLRGEIASIHGQEASLRGQIASVRGSIASLEASRWGTSADERARIDTQIRRHEAEIDAIEARIRQYNADGRVREVERRIGTYEADRRAASEERRIREYDVSGRVARVNAEIEALDMDRRVSRIERDIVALDADRRVRELEADLDRAIARLRAAVRR